MEQKIRATLKLENGMEFHGFSFGYKGPCDGEVVFSTAMTGYTESLTDPAYSGQILCITYPIVGNYGVPEESLDENGISRFMESARIQVRGLAVSDYSENYSHWKAAKSLGKWLEDHKIPGIYGIDTRELTKVIRDKGTMLGIIVPENRVRDFPVDDPNLENLVAGVGCRDITEYGEGSKRIVLLDCGVRHNMLRYFAGRDVRLVRVPWNYDFNALAYDGLLLSDGPGNPEHCNVAVKHLREALGKDKPILGIGLGHELLSRAAGAVTRKLKCGHRGHNQPVRMAGTNRCFITSQNHGYVVDTNTLGADWEPYFVNMNDGTNEGIRHKSKPFFSCQFQPDTVGGHADTGFLLEGFMSKL